MSILLVLLVFLLFFFPPLNAASCLLGCWEIVRHAQPAETRVQIRRQTVLRVYLSFKLWVFKGQVWGAGRVGRRDHSTRAAQP